MIINYWAGGGGLIWNSLTIHDHTAKKGVITVKDTILLSELTGHRWRHICFDRLPFMFQSVVHINCASEYILAILTSIYLWFVCAVLLSLINWMVKLRYLTLKQRKNLFINYSNEKLLLTPSHVKSYIL